MRTSRLITIIMTLLISGSVFSEIKYIEKEDIFGLRCSGKDENLRKHKVYFVFQKEIDDDSDFYFVDVGQESYLDGINTIKWYGEYAVKTDRRYSIDHEPKEYSLREGRYYIYRDSLKFELVPLAFTLDYKFTGVCNKYEPEKVRGFVEKHNKRELSKQRI